MEISDYLSYSLEVKCNENCPICLETIYNNDNNTHKLACGHNFHTHCIIRHFRLMRDGRCPMCRDHDNTNPSEVHILFEEERDYSRTKRKLNEIARKNPKIHKSRQRYWDKKKEYKQLEKEYIDYDKQLYNTYFKDPRRSELSKRVNKCWREMNRKKINFEKKAYKELNWQWTDESL